MRTRNKRTHVIGHTLHAVLLVTNPMTGMQAASNAKHNHGMSKVKLYVSEAYANEAMYFKRLSFRAMGRSSTYPPPPPPPILV